MKRRFITADGRFDYEAIDKALLRRINHYAEFCQHIPDLIAVEEWVNDVFAALRCEIEIELRHHTRRTLDGQ